MQKGLDLARKEGVLTAKKQHFMAGTYNVNHDRRTTHLPSQAAAHGLRRTLSDVIHHGQVQGFNHPKRPQRNSWSRDKILHNIGPKNCNQVIDIAIEGLMVAPKSAPLLKRLFDRRGKILRFYLALPASLQYSRLYTLKEGFSERIRRVSVSINSVVLQITPGNTVAQFKDQEAEISPKGSQRQYRQLGKLMFLDLHASNTVMREPRASLAEHHMEGFYFVFDFARYQFKICHVAEVSQTKGLRNLQALASNFDKSGSLYVYGMLETDLQASTSKRLSQSDTHYIVERDTVLTGIARSSSYIACSLTFTLMLQRRRGPTVSRTARDHYRIQQITCDVWGKWSIDVELHQTNKNASSNSRRSTLRL
ncbi:uncharacterized protein CLUP02_16703 [Colletotrichum lupini]|uniref:Uncharacterized protein n=1 Tax=Colletotrichum lupini TaxID=145971 RepID=A0A9Q8T8B4_9PEZI|nr:uncharacterized protein CLUP02_16703 [Colletotrichum lupini]UQC91169.1 hypothetical protein CLUP02_16703 [Colletotrichum lupini]